MAWKARQAAKQKKNTIAAQKEAQKREADTLSRKHLAGLRVVQKNLVYVTGLSPSVQEDDLLETLRGPNYFGQYGKIVKIVVSKAKEPHTQSVGVYVTYARKQDAAQCIQAVDGTQNVDRVLRYVAREPHPSEDEISPCCKGDLYAELFSGRNSVRQSTARPTSVTSSARIAIACFYTSLARTMRALRDKTCPR